MHLNSHLSFIPVLQFAIFFIPSHTRPTPPLPLSFISLSPLTLSFLCIYDFIFSLSERWAHDGAPAELVNLNRSLSLCIPAPTTLHPFNPPPPPFIRSPSLFPFLSPAPLISDSCLFSSLFSRGGSGKLWRVQSPRRGSEEHRGWQLLVHEQTAGRHSGKHVCQACVCAGKMYAVWGETKPHTHIRFYRYIIHVCMVFLLLCFLPWTIEIT